MTAFIGNIGSEEAPVDFTTKPSEAAKDELNLEILPGVHSVSGS